MTISKQQPKRARVSKIVPLYQQQPENRDWLRRAFDGRAEEALLGAVLLEPDLYTSLADIVQPSDFFLLWNGFIWHTFEQLQAAGRPIDLLSVATEAAKHPQIAADGAFDDLRLASLPAACPDPRNADYYAKQVRERAVRLRVMEAADAMKSAALDDALPLERLIDECNERLFTATEQHGDIDSSAKAIVSHYYDHVETLMHARRAPGIPTGFDKVDAYLGGMQPGEVIVLGGNEGMGKTAMLLSIVRNVAGMGLKAALFSLEMSQDEIVQALMAMESGIPRHVLRSPSVMAAQQWQSFVNAAGIIGNWPLQVMDMNEYPQLTPLQLRRRVRKLQAQEGLDLVVIDGLWLMEATQSAGDRTRDVFTITRDLTGIAKQFNVPILITHQYNANALSRKRKERKPTLFDLAESAGVRRNCQVILGLFRESYFDKNALSKLTQIYTLKDRNGTSTGQTYDFHFDLARGSYSEARNEHFS